jgi:hypothetical protein
MLIIALALVVAGVGQLLDWDEKLGSYALLFYAGLGLLMGATVARIFR